jgi:site-specific recombinase XerC
MVKGNLLTADEDAAISLQELRIGDHFEAYLLKLEAAGVSRQHRSNVKRQLSRVAADCRLTRLSDLTTESLQRWLVNQQRSGMGGRTRNTYRAAWIAFGNWCVDSGRLLTNPLEKVSKADEDVDRRRTRRALTEEELERLLQVARSRPLAEAMTIRRGKRKGQTAARLRPKVRQHLDRVGWERSLIYKTLVLTGLRKSELASITVGQVSLESELPHLVLEAACSKNRESACIPLRADLAEDLRRWLEAS